MREKRERRRKIVCQSSIIGLPPTCAPPSGKT